MKETVRKYQTIFPSDEKDLWREVLKNIEYITEIRMKAEKPILIYLNQKEVSINEKGDFIYVPEKGKIVSYTELQQYVDYWCMDSRYAFLDEIKRGFLTIEGGHRIGICGEAVSDEEGKVKSIKYISSVNIRIAHEIKNVAKKILENLYNGRQIKNTLIISSPGAGKTTLLRDIIRLLSDGNREHPGVPVGVVDERGEIAACFKGIPQLDVGMRTDVMDNCKKAEGMRMLLRSMAPEVIAVDELGSVEEVELIQQMMGNGCTIIATIHGENVEQVMKKPIFFPIREQQLFQNMIQLSRDKNHFQMEFYQGKEPGVCYRC